MGRGAQAQASYVAGSPVPLPLPGPPVCLLGMPSILGHASSFFEWLLRASVVVALQILSQAKNQRVDLNKFYLHAVHRQPQHFIIRRVRHLLRFVLRCSIHRVT